MSQDKSSVGDRIEAECHDCGWRFLNRTADELAGLGGRTMDDVIEEHARLHARASGHENVEVTDGQ